MRMRTGVRAGADVSSPERARVFKARGRGSMQSDNACGSEPSCKQAPPTFPPPTYILHIHIGSAVPCERWETVRGVSHGGSGGQQRRWPPKQQEAADGQWRSVGFPNSPCGAAPVPVWLWKPVPVTGADDYIRHLLYWQL